MFYKIANKVFLYTSSLYILIFLFLLYCYDPLHIYHNKKQLYNNNMYANAFFIINNINYDSIIIGTSMLENTSSKEASEKLGGKFINVSLSGSTLKARNVLLKYILRRKKLKKIVLSLDVGSFDYFLDTEQPNYFPLKDWAFLYDKNPFNNIKIYFNDKYLKCFLKWSNEKKCIGYEVDYDRPAAWFVCYTWNGVINWSVDSINYFILNYKDRNDSNLPNIRLVKQRAIEYIFKLITKYKNTDFILIIPPYSTLFYTTMLQNKPNNFALIQETLKFLTSECDKYSNCKLFAFNNDNFTDNLRNYKDMTHYSEKINLYMLDKISINSNIITDKNIDSYLNEFNNRVTTYDIEVVVRELKEKGLWK